MIFLYDDAYYMYGAGWRSTDRDELVEEYYFTEDEIDEVILLLREIEMKKVNEDGK